MASHCHSDSCARRPPCRGPAAVVTARLVRRFPPRCGVRIAGLQGKAARLDAGQSGDVGLPTYLMRGNSICRR